MLGKIYGWLGIIGLVVAAAIAAFIAGQIVVHNKVASAERRPVLLQDLERIKAWRRATLPLCAPGGGIERLVPTDKQAKKLGERFGVEIASEADIKAAAARARAAAARRSSAGAAEGDAGGEIVAQTGTRRIGGWLSGLFRREEPAPAAEGADGGVGQAENTGQDAPGGRLPADPASGQGVGGQAAAEALAVDLPGGRKLVPMLYQDVPRLRHGAELLVGMPVDGGKLEAHIFPNRDKFWNWNPAPLELGLGANLPRLGAGSGDKLTRAWLGWEPVEMGQGWFARLEAYGQQLEPELPAYDEGGELAKQTDTGALVSIVWRPTLLK